ncbi:uncharacterized protein [Heterodontus francisci]|uniref:uncharacterized protein n=1 Tax=Heterodontus francisci TaxID=7792 RepID=UPI00355C2C2B
MDTGDAGGIKDEVPQELESSQSEEEDKEDSEDEETSSSLAAAGSETDTARILEAWLEEGSACDETPAASVQDPGRWKRMAQVAARPRLRLNTSSAAEESDEDFDGPGYRRMLMGVHNQVAGALESLPESLRAMSRSVEESSSDLARSFTQSLKLILSNMEQVVTSISTPMDPSMMQRLMAEVTASISAQTASVKVLSAAVEAQTAALQAQTAAVVALDATVRRGFQDLTAVQQISRNAEAQPRESGSGSIAPEPPVLSQADSIPAPTLATPPVPLLLPVGHQARKIAAGRSKPKAARGHPPRTSAASSFGAQYLSDIHAATTGEAPYRSTRIDKGTWKTETKGNTQG